MADATLSSYLRERRERLDPAALGYPGGRRRTPRLRREEVAQRANISATWYSWLEQGRGGAPSAGVLNRIAKALLLTDAERGACSCSGWGACPTCVITRPPASPHGCNARRCDGNQPGLHPHGELGRGRLERGGRGGGSPTTQRCRPANAMCCG